MILIGIELLVPSRRICIAGRKPKAHWQIILASANLCKLSMESHVSLQPQHSNFRSHCRPKSLYSLHKFGADCFCVCVCVCFFSVFQLAQALKESMSASIMASLGPKACLRLLQDFSKVQTCEKYDLQTTSLYISEDFMLGAETTMTAREVARLYTF